MVNLYEAIHDIPGANCRPVFVFLYRRFDLNLNMIAIVLGLQKIYFPFSGHGRLDIIMAKIYKLSTFSKTYMTAPFARNLLLIKFIGKKNEPKQSNP